MRLRAAAIAAYASLLVAPHLAAQFPPTELKNVKALPKDISVRALVDTMKAFTRALGVRCTYCHVGREDQDLSQYDFVSDEKPTKVKAREMLRMVGAINGQYLAALPARSSPTVVVTCSTCHRGVSIPRPIQQIVTGAYQAGGLDSAVAAYRALRTRYYGSAAYDFGEVPLTEIAQTAQSMGRSQDAIKLHQLNVELLPQSGFALRQLGFSYLVINDTADALVAWRKRLALTPDNPEAKDLVDRLTKKP